MSKMFWLTASVIFLLGAHAQSEDIQMIQSTVAINSAFVPGGFDSDNDVYVIVSGIFQNTCYTWREALVKKSGASPVLNIEVVANVIQGRPCMRVLVPFQKEVYIGKMSPGQYTLQFANGDGTFFTESLTIDQ